MRPGKQLSTLSKNIITNSISRHFYTSDIFIFQQGFDVFRKTAGRLDAMIL